ncbi:anti-sigma factor family protein [Paractinoplanes durhamensis]|uniref:anti-sigma factor family protein n=1 Tax=Paractinoplanes durhamensis TaxID=113563 RepID=UPI0031CEC743
MSGHETALLGAYVLGVLDRAEQGAVQDHLDGCAACRREVDDLREMEIALGEIPPEAFLEGPPPGGELLLRRTLDEVRGERRRQTWRNRTLLATAAALVVAVALGGGALIGRPAAGPAPDAVAVVPAGTRTATATDAATGVTMAVEVRPAAGWVRVRATVSGIPAGEQCRLVVVAPDGSREQAGSWLGPESGSTTVDGAALIAPADVAAVQAETYAGQILVTTPL